MSNIPQRASRPVSQDYEPDDEDDYTASVPRSAIRYPIGRPYTFTQGNRRIGLHPEPPPIKHRGNWMGYVGLGMMFMLALYVGCHIVGNWGENHVYWNPLTDQ